MSVNRTDIRPIFPTSPDVFAELKPARPTATSIVMRWLDRLVVTLGLVPR